MRRKRRSVDASTELVVSCGAGLSNNSSGCHGGRKYTVGVVLVWGGVGLGGVVLVWCEVGWCGVV